MIIAIDGPAASGKGTLARRIAAAFCLPHLDTGLLYRATARAVLDAGHDLTDEAAAVAAAATLDMARCDGTGRDGTGYGWAGFDEARLRGKAMGEAASVVAAMPQVRAALVAAQRAFAEAPRGAVLDGRDIGTVICPTADAKIFVVASAMIRARRRALELDMRGETVEFASVLADIQRRDERDSGRSTAPLRQADDAFVLDTSDLDVESAVAAALALVHRKVGDERLASRQAGRA